MSTPRMINDTKGVALTGSPHSQAIISRDGVVYCGGQLPMDATGTMIQGTIKEKTRQCLSNLQAVLKNAGSDMDLVLKVQIFLQDMSDFGEVNEEYKTWWPGSYKPARSCVAVKTLPRGATVEIECVAQLSDDSLRSKL